MERWGLTGGIASGKSLAAQRLRQWGLTVVDADALAREVVAAGSPGLAEVVARFGPGVLRPDGSLDRPALGARVFSDAAARVDLNAITHPRIAALAGARAEQARAAGARVFVYEAPLLVENGLHRGLDEVLLVAVSPQTQLERLQSRDGLGLEAARARLAAQLPLDDKRRAATVVFDNEGTAAQLLARVDAFLEARAARLGLGSPPSPTPGN